MIPFPPPLAASPADDPASAELQALARADQDDRMGWETLSQKARQAMAARDTLRLARVKALLRAGRVRNRDDFDAASLICQHGATREDYQLAHELAVCAGIQGKIASLPAVSQDRLLRKLGRPQRFGTQYRRAGSGWALEATDETGETAVTDALRADLLVPPLAMARRDVHAGMRLTDAVIARQERRRDPAWLARAAQRPEAAELEQLAAAPEADSRRYPAQRARALELYRADALATPADYRNAARTLLRSGAATDALLAHELAMIAAIRGDHPARALLAQAWDAFLLAIGQPPRYRGASAPAAVRAAFDLLSATPT